MKNQDTAFSFCASGTNYDQYTLSNGLTLNYSWGQRGENWT